MIPIINIDASQILEAFDKIVKGIHQVGFDAIATIVDGHSANTMFYKTLSQNFNGKETCITDDGESSDERAPHDLETDETMGSLVKEPVAVKTVPENGIKNTGGSTLQRKKVDLLECVFYYLSVIYLLYDPVHIFKNIFNNWLRKLNFVCPYFDDLPMSVNFQFVKDRFRVW